jgi:hypothetical protein
MLISSPAAANASTLITFGDYETETEISTQYASQGVVFKDEFGYYPEIRWDNSASTNPVLSGTFGFGSPITAEFVVPGTTTPAAVENLAMDVGYIDEPWSTELVINRTSGPIVLYADEYGFNHLFLGGSGITGFVLKGNEEDPQGFELDNLSYTIPAPPPPPPPPPPAAKCPKYVVYDSRGSGEPKGISNPGEAFLRGFRDRLKSLNVGGVVTPVSNRYPAVGVWSWNPLKVGDRLNGVGAILGIGKLGAYTDSTREGEAEVKSFVKDQVKSKCGKAGTKIVLLGYSQGAQATGDAYEDLGAAQRKHIAAVAMWGDPLYNHTNHPADRDHRNKNGLLGTRKGLPDGNKVFSYCNTHDPICQWPMSNAEYIWYRGKEHSLYYKSKPAQAENNGKEVASFLVKGR